MKRYFNSDNSVVLPDTPWSRNINGQNKLAFVRCDGDNATILLHDKFLHVSTDEAEIEKDNLGWFIRDFYSDDEEND
jgi:hypothetical protein